MLFTAAIVLVSLWLGWDTRDKAGERNGEMSVGRVGLPKKLSKPVMLVDYEAKDTDELGPAD
jgi:hypothetical protein